MKELLQRSVFAMLLFVLANVFIIRSAQGQSCSSNNIGFNNNTATNTLAICVGITGTTINGGNPSGSETFLWQVSSTLVSGPFSTVSPNPGDIQNWTISSNYYNNPGTYYFRRVISDNGSGCNGNSDVVTLTVNATPNDITVSGGGTICGINTTLNASNGGSGTIYYQGTTSNGTSVANPSTSQLITVSGTYYFRARSASGCWGNQVSSTVLLQTPPSTTGTSICQRSSGSITSSTVCPDFVNSGTTISGSWNAGTDPVANRLNDGITNTSSCAFESPAVSRNYSSQYFRVSATGSYTFAMNQNNAYDGMGYIVSGAFVPGNCSGGGSFIRGDDDSGPSNEPSMTATLTAGVTYRLISTTNSTSSGTYSGNFTWSITAPGGAQIMLPVDSDIQWFTSAAGGLAIGSGSPFNPVGVSGSGLEHTNTPGTTVFYAECAATPGCRTATNFVIKALPGAPEGSNAQSYCTGSTVADLQANGTALKWYEFSNSSNPLSNATALVNGSHYYASQTIADCESAARLDVVVTIIENASLDLTSGPGSNVQSVCYNSQVSPVSYTIGGGASGANVSGLPAGVTGLFNSGVITISGAATETGVFNYTVTTTGTCVQTTATGSITVTALPTATYTRSNVSACGVAPDGSIDVIASGGTGAYTYTWSGVIGSGNPATTPYPAPGNLPSVSDLTIGFYHVTVSDAQGCQVAINNIHIQYAFSAYVTYNGSISSACSNSGSIILYANAGIQPYSFSLDGTNFTTDNSFTNLGAGLYTAHVKDGAGCVVSKSIQINAAAPVVVNPFVVGSSSCADDGYIEVYRTGGIPPYAYSLDGVNYQVSNRFMNLAAGPYTTYVKDSENCIGTALVTVSQGSALGISVNKTNASKCENDGSIQVNATGGMPPYSFSINGGAFQQGNAFTGLAAGNYSITAKDHRGCLGSANVTIGLNTISVTAFVTNSDDCYNNNGSIELFRTGGVGPYTYSLDGNTYQSSSFFTNLAPGEYDGYVKDSKTCIGGLYGIVVGSGCESTFTKSNSGAADKNATKGNAISLSSISELKISAYPNPSTTEFTLDLLNRSNEKITISITDMLGRKIRQIELNNKNQYRFGSDLQPGLYYVQVVQGNQKQSVKIIKE